MPPRAYNKHDTKRIKALHTCKHRTCIIAGKYEFKCFIHFVKVGRSQENCSMMLLMRFKPQTSCVRSDRFTNWTTTTAIVGFEVTTAWLLSRALYYLGMHSTALPLNKAKLICFWGRKSYRVDSPPSLSHSLSLSLFHRKAPFKFSIGKLVHQSLEPRDQSFRWRLRFFSILGFLRFV